MGDIKTFDGGNHRDPLITQQKESISRMRTALLSCTLDNPLSIKQSINQVTVLRIYHQVTRIVRYLDMLDKLEDKIYKLIEEKMAVTELDDPDLNTAILSQLLVVNESLQKTMVSSHKLLEPYMNVEAFGITELMPINAATDSEILIMSPDSREKVRNTAQQVLSALNTM